MTAQPRRLQAVNTNVSLDDVLMCKDRSIGHDWPHDVVWEDGPTERVGRGRGATTVYICYRTCRCIRCGTQRREMFEQDDRAGEIRKVSNRTRYYYSPIWLEYERLEQAQIRYRLRRAAK